MTLSLDTFFQVNEATARLDAMDHAALSKALGVTVESSASAVDVKVPTLTFGDVSAKYASRSRVYGK